MMTYVVHGKPIPQPRPRVGRYGVYKHTLSDGSPHPIYAWREWVTITTRSVRRALGRERGLIGGPLKVTLLFQMPRPDRHFSKKTKMLLPSAPLNCDRKPDIDNLVKAVFDSISDSGVIWTDDNQVTQLIVEKRWSSTRDGGVCIKIEQSELRMDGRTEMIIDKKDLIGFIIG